MKGIKGTAAEGEVSTADMIALAAAYAVRITGGPAIDVPVGERHVVAQTSRDARRGAGQQV